MMRPTADHIPLDRLGSARLADLRNRLIRRMSLATAVLVLTFGCAGEIGLTEPEPSPTQAVSVDVEPGSVTLQPGETVQMQATPRDEDGNAVSGYQITWSSEDPSIATVNTDGVAAGQSEGSTRITATAEKEGQTLSGGSELAVTTSPGTSGDVVTSVEPASYETDTLALGEAVYVDREYTIDGVPSGYRGWTYIRTANDDKSVTADSAVTFTLDDTARVVLAYDERATTLPDWLQDWTATGDSLRTTDVDYAIHERVFGPGTVALGGNLSGGAQGANSMYVLFAVASDTAPDDDGGGGTDPQGGVLTVATATSGSSLDPDGYSVTLDGGSGRTVGVTSEVTYTGLSSGDYSVALSGIASNCSVGGTNPRTVSVVEGDTASTTFDVTCENTGPAPDPAKTVTFEQYGSTDDLRQDCAVFQDCLEDLGLAGPQGGIYLDEGVGYSAAGLTKSMRYDWVDQGCTSISRGRGVALPSDREEVWFELVVRWSTNFTSDNPDCPPADWKSYFGQVVPDGSGRFQLKWTRDVRMAAPRGDVDPTSVSVLGNAVNNTSSDPVKARVRFGLNPADYFDEQWHVIRVHWKAASTAGSDDGMMELWVDGVYMGGLADFETNDVSLRALLLGRNKDKGVDSGVESYWLGRLRIWNQDPGW